MPSTITLATIAKSKSKLRRRRDESTEDFVGRMTHVHLTGRGIEDNIGCLKYCRRAVALYLYDNKIARMTALSSLGQLTSLTHLYLQNNKIERIQGLSAGNLPNLTKLYLGHNCIALLEGLERLPQLRELRLPYQTLPPGERLLFDPRSLLALSQQLTVLDICGNNIDDMSDLTMLQGLVRLYLADNRASQLDELAWVLQTNPQLERLSLKGNPLCGRPKWRDQVVVMSESLQELDGQEISATTRTFLVNWSYAKARGRAAAAAAAARRRGGGGNGRGGASSASPSAGSSATSRLSHSGRGSAPVGSARSQGAASDRSLATPLLPPIAAGKVSL